MEYRFLLAGILFVLVLSSGCVRMAGTGANETTEIVVENVSGNESLENLKGDFTFKIIGLNEFQVSPGEKTRFYVVFYNTDEDKESHKFIAKAIPSAVDFDVKAAYKCSYFTDCPKLQNDMNGWINHTREQIEINYTYVGVQRIGIEVSEDAEKGTYMYDVIACKDLGFNQCDRSSSNWGPVLSLTLRILES
jgi:hypothetical protein